MTYRPEGQQESRIDRLIRTELDSVEKPMPKTRQATRLRSPEQYAYMTNLAGQQGMSHAELNILIGTEYGQTLDTITMTNASKIIKRLLKNLGRIR